MVDEYVVDVVTERVRKFSSDSSMVDEYKSVPLQDHRYNFVHIPLWSMNTV